MLKHAAMVFLGGGLGAVLRFLILKATAGWAAFPWGVMLINLSGSFLLGMCLGWIQPDARGQTLWFFLATGVLGGYTTFSTFSGDTLLLLQQQRYALALIYSLGSTVLGVVFAYTGWVLTHTQK